MDKILNASYGDKGQRQDNQRHGDRKAARELLLARAQKRGVNPPIEIPEPKDAKGYRPPFWQSKLYGEPYGAFVPRKVEKPKFDALGAGGVVPPGPRPGRPASARDPSRAGAAAAPVARPSSARPPYLHDPKKLGGEMEALEDRMRKAVKARTKLHEVDRDVLIKIFKRSGCEGHGEMAMVNVSQFRSAWRTVGITVSPEHAVGVFNKYGQDVRGYMPCRVYAEGLLVGRSRHVGMAGDVQRRPYQVGKPAVHMGKILYPPARKGVFPPTDWDPATALRSEQKPTASLKLEFVHGYAGKTNTSTNLFYNAHGEVVYYVAGLGVVYNQQKHTQRFFCGHDDDIKSIAVHPKKVVVATGQVGKYPTVCVWDSRTTQELARLKHDAVRGIIALTFTQGGSKLLSVGTDNGHTVHLWDWQRKQLLFTRKGAQGAPPQVFGIVFSPYSAHEFVTYGVNHCRFWQLVDEGNGQVGATSSAGTFEKAGTHSVLSACHLPSGLLVTGHPEGMLCVWKGGKCLRVVRAHQKGPTVIREDGSNTFGGVRAIRLRGNQRVMLSAGADGCVIEWDVSGGDVGPIIKKVQLAAAYEGLAPPSFRSLDCWPGSDVFIAGTNRCDIWEVDATPEVLIYGHEADVYGIATHPTRPNLFVTVSESDKVFFWDATARKCVATVATGKKCRSVAYSTDGDHVAVGMKGGGIKVLDAATLQPVHWSKPFESGVDELKYSPDGRWLAAGSHDTLIGIFDRDNGYQQVAMCKGASGTITHVDWSSDGKVLQSNDGAYEILYWNPSNGKQVKQNQRDRDWHTMTCILGFPVMGIWPDGSDGTDVNALDRSNNRRFCATSDDFGLVKLFAYPCVIEDAPSRAYNGHSSHVTGVRFSCDDRRVVTVGGHDRAVFQWRTHALTDEDNIKLPEGECPMDDCRICGPQTKLGAAGAPWAPMGEKEGFA